MYESHFGLNGRPFGETVESSAYVALPSRDAALRRLRYGLERDAGAGLVFGPAGAGKTLLARVLADSLGGTVVHLAFPAMPPAELIAFLADELAAPPAPGPGMAGSVRRLRTAFAAASARGHRPLLIVDEAHLIEDSGTFEALRLLMNFTTGGTPDVHLALVGGPEILLHLPPGLADRVAVRCLLGPLTQDEAATYLTGRLQAAGATRRLFDDDAIRALYLAADGLPRRLNRLADLALLIAYAREQDQPDAETVALAEREAGFPLLAA
jgi:type II secretory pathway predicted ATPase ExeA